MTSWQLYWLTRMDKLGDFLSMAGGILSLLAVASLFILAIANFERDLENKNWWNLPKYSTIVGILFLIASCFIPTTKEMATIIILPRISQSLSSNQKLKELPDNILDLANEWLKELKPKADSKWPAPQRRLRS